MPFEMNSSSIPSALSGVDLELVSTDVGDMWFPLMDRVMRDHIRNARTWEPDIGRALIQTFPSDGVFLDIGANVGYFSLMIASRFPRATVHAFEPHPLTSQVLRLNTWPYADRVNVWACALGDRRGTVALSTSANNLGDTKGIVAKDRLVANVIAPVVPLDELLKDVRADVVKIDVQGAEMAVLAGMSGFILRSRGIRIVMEFSPGLLRAEHIDPRAVLGQLREQGFDLNLIRPDALFAATDDEILSFCYSAGPLGQANLMLSSRA